MKGLHLLVILSIFVSSSVFSQSSSVKLLKKHFTSAEAKKAKIDRKVDYLTSEEKQIFLYMNLCRLYPKKFAEFYLAYLQQYDENGYKRWKQKDSYYFTLYQDLKRQKPLEALASSKKMFDLAKCWAKESGSKGIVGHNRRRCKDGYDSECCSYSSSSSVLNLLWNLLVDDDTPSFGHRRTILTNYKEAGVSIQKHKTYGYCVVIDFSY